MMKCFLSCSFLDNDRDVRVWFTDFLQAFPETEVVVAKDHIQPPIEQVEKCLGECQLACFIITERNGSISSWIIQEVEMARGQGLTLFGFVEKQIPESVLGALPACVSFQQFDRANLEDMIPDYIRYFYNARIAALKKQQIDRRSLVRTIKRQKKINEELARQIELLELMNEPRMFDD